MKRFVVPALSVLALLLAVAAIAVGSFSLVLMVRLQRGALLAVTEARAALADVPERAIEISIPLQQTFPISASVPLRQDFVVPIQATLPISTVVRVPVEVPILGTYQMSVPVVTEVPIDLEVVIPVSQTVPVATEVSLDTEVPVRLEMDQLGLDDLLIEVDRVLGQIEQGLQSPFSRSD